MTRIDLATVDDIYQVAVNMRERDYAEISALHYAVNRETLAQTLARGYGDNPDVLCASYEGRPIAIGGCLTFRPNVASLLMFSTDEFPRVGLTVARFIRRQMFPRLEQAGIHRFEAVTLAGYTEIHDWMRTLGLEAETGPLRNFGKNGEAFIYYAKVVDVRSSGA